MMTNFIFLFFTCAIAAFIPVQENTVTQRLIVHSSSTVTFDGKTNVKKYQCAIGRYSGSDTLVIMVDPGKGVRFKKGLARLNAPEFDCGMMAITKDFGEIIQAEKYPYIKIDFISFERAPRYESTEEKFKSNLTITLGDVAVPCEVRCSLVKDEKGLIHLRGKRNFKFSDFNLEPPTKMMGLIKVDEKITVNFHLVLLQL